MLAIIFTEDPVSVIYRNCEYDPYTSYSDNDILKYAVRESSTIALSYKDYFSQRLLRHRSSAFGNSVTQLSSRTRYSALLDCSNRQICVQY